MQRHIVLIALLILTPHLLWGFSFERTASYKKQAEVLHLSQSAQWLRLGHYRKKWNGTYHSPIRGNFFVSPSGSEDPSSELNATLDLLFSEPGAKQQCRYLARTRWLRKALPIASEDLIACPERDEWKKQLGVTEAYLIFAASDLSSAPSSFGHTFLRLHNPKNIGSLNLLDYGVNYAAVTGEESGALYAIKGLFGLYPGTFSMLPYHQKIREYTNLEGRDLWEYKLNLNEEQVEFMINHLLELEGSWAPYFFADDNCSAQILELIEATRPDVDLSSQFYDFVVPLDTVKVLAESHMLVDEKPRRSLRSEWDTRYTYLNFTQRAALKNIVQTTTFDNEFYKTLDKKEKAETLEASMSFLALQEYKEQKEHKPERYKYAVARAQLGPVTEPLRFEQPKSPLFSGDAQAFYAFYGKEDHVDFYSLKYRRGFHDLLSDDSGLAPFSQLNIMSFEFRYKPTLQNLDLYEWKFIDILSTSSWTEYERPWTWKLQVGTSPKFSAYFNGGIGAGTDLPMAQATRWSFLALTENDQLTETANPHVGIETLFMNKWSGNFRSVIDGKYLYSTAEGRWFGEASLGMSYSIGKAELRAEAKVRDSKDLWMLGLMF